MVGQQVPFLGPGITGVSKRDRNFLPACEVSDKHNSIINRVVNGRGQPLHYGLVIFGTDLKGSSVIAPRPNTCFRFRVTRVSPLASRLQPAPYHRRACHFGREARPKLRNFARDRLRSPKASRIRRTRSSIWSAMSRFFTRSLLIPLRTSRTVSAPSRTRLAARTKTDSKKPRRGVLVDQA
jgi:hypothetical protein